MKAMNSLIVSLVLLCGTAVLVAQAHEWEWAVGAGGTGSDRGRSIAIDNQGNQYVTVYFKGTATFGSHTLTSGGSYDIFVAKMDPSGNWLCAVKARGTTIDLGCDIAVDGVGNAYVTGEFEVTATFGSLTLTSNDDYDPDIFIAKLGSGTPVEDNLAPEAVSRLYNAWPNPLGRGASALIKADIAERSTGTLSIYNLRGQIVASFELALARIRYPSAGTNFPRGSICTACTAGLTGKPGNWCC